MLGILIFDSLHVISLKIKPIKMVIQMLNNVHVLTYVL
jgi:hypothetical protein